VEAKRLPKASIEPPLVTFGSYPELVQLHLDQATYGIEELFDELIPLLSNLRGKPAEEANEPKQMSYLADISDHRVVLTIFDTPFGVIEVKMEAEIPAIGFIFQSWFVDEIGKVRPSATKGGYRITMNAQDGKITSVLWDDQEIQPVDPRMYYTVEKLDNLRFTITLHNTPLGDVREVIVTDEPQATGSQMFRVGGEVKNPAVAIEYANGKVTSVKWDGRTIRQRRTASDFIWPGGLFRRQAPPRSLKKLIAFLLCLRKAPNLSKNHKRLSKMFKWGWTTHHTHRSSLDRPPRSSSPVLYGCQSDREGPCVNQYFGFSRKTRVSASHLALAAATSISLQNWQYGRSPFRPRCLQRWIVLSLIPAATAADLRNAPLRTAFAICLPGSE